MRKNNPPVTPEQIIAAYHTNVGFAHKTPVLTNEFSNRKAGAALFFKCENFQKAGAFKFRGAHYAISQLTDEERMAGVCTHSSGNHAQALALAASIHGMNAHIVMPENSPKVKVNAVKNYGGQITFCKPTLQARENTLAEVQKRTGATFIHPYNNYNIIRGQAGCFYEMINQVEQILDYVVVPVGGGGLTSGTALVSHFFSPKTKVIAAEPEGANDAWQSFRSKQFIPSHNPVTIADGLKTSLGDLTYPIIMNMVDDVLTVSEQQIKDTLKWVWERMKIIIEPSAAVSLAAVFSHKQLFEKSKTGVIFSGGNIDFESLNL
ncbi:MAG: pyridoxal-phosphate dependent enzyme [Bacteroidales bacterium]